MYGQGRGEEEKNYKKLQNQLALWKINLSSFVYMCLLYKLSMSQMWNVPQVCFVFCLVFSLRKHGPQYRLMSIPSSRLQEMHNKTPVLWVFTHAWIDLHSLGVFMHVIVHRIRASGTAQNLGLYVYLGLEFVAFFWHKLFISLQHSLLRSCQHSQLHRLILSKLWETTDLLFLCYQHRSPSDPMCLLFNHLASPTALWLGHISICTCRVAPMLVAMLQTRFLGVHDWTKTPR